MALRRSWPAALAMALTLIWAGPAAAADPPAITTTWVTNVATTSANLRAEISPEGQSASYRFEYVTEAAFRAQGFTAAQRVPAVAEASLGSGSAAVAVVQHLGALKADTAYRYRVVATNTAGPATGPLRYLRPDQIAPTFSLPDSRGWEMVSPVDKNGGEIQGFGQNFGGDVLQAATDGLSVTYSSASSFAGGQGAPPASQYLSRRTPGGWLTENVSGPTEAGAYGDHPDGVPFQLFSGDLARALVLEGHLCATQPCPRSYLERDNASGVLSTLASEEPDLRFAGATPDLGHLLFSTCAALSADAVEVPGPGGCDPSQPNLYEFSGSTLRLINLLPGQATGVPGAALAAPSGAISADGTRVYFTHAGNLYLRDAGRTVQVDEGAGGGGSFQVASADGSVAYFTVAGHLYRYTLAAEAATDLTPAGEVQGVLGASAGGERVYYLSASGLFLSEGGTSKEAAPAADPSNYPPATGAARVSADGRELAFASSSAAVAEEAAYDNAGRAELYLYEEVTGALTCVSCNPSGERPIGPASLPGASPNGSGSAAYKPRALSADARRLFFDSFDALVPQDTNNDRDVYQWEAQGEGSCAQAGGCASLISSGRAEGGASFIDASASGDDAFFLTDGSLVGSDPGSVDLYDARAGDGFPSPESPIPCLGDACQPLPPEPEDPSPGTLRSRPQGNEPLRYGKPKPVHKKHHHHKHHKPKKGGRR